MKREIEDDDKIVEKFRVPEVFFKSCVLNQNSELINPDRWKHQLTSNMSGSGSSLSLQPDTGIDAETEGLHIDTQI